MVNFHQSLLFLNTLFSLLLVPQEFPARISRKIFPQDFPELYRDWLANHHPILNAKFPPITTFLKYPFFPPPCPTKFSRKIFPQDFPPTISHNNFPQSFPARFSCKILPQQIPARFSRTIFLQDYPTWFSRKIFLSCILIVGYPSSYTKC